MDQVHLPDPVLNDIRELQQENIKLHKKLEDMIKYMHCVGNAQAAAEAENAATETVETDQQAEK